ncbi:MAG: type II secretion system F family protein [Planctomycetaceae bacterium]|nr:type II secretion system F family protein [Planctomycetaceae bacterium]
MPFQISNQSFVEDRHSNAISSSELTDLRASLTDQGGPASSPLRSSHFSSGASSPKQSWSRGHVRKTDLLMITSQLSIMCQSGIDLAEALRAVSVECRHPKLKKILELIYQDVQDGIPASSAIRTHAAVFGEAYIASISAAEASGTVTEVLPRLAEMLQNEIRLRSSLKSVLAYPVVLIGVAFVVLNVLVFFVMPQFGKVFASLDRPAPPLTALLLDISQLLRSHVIAIAFGAVGAIIGLMQLARTEAARRYWDGFVLNSRLLRGATRSLLSGRSFRLMGTMLQSGVPLLEAVRMCRQSINNLYFRELFDSLERNVVNGEGLAPAVASAEFVPSGAAQMISTAERTGKLGMVMELIGEFYEDEGERLIRQLVKLLEPAIIVVMGVFVAGVVLSVILPLLDVSTISR